MKKVLSILCGVICCCMTLSAQWVNNPEESYLVWPADSAYYDNKVAIAPDGTTWVAIYYPEDGTVKVNVQAIDSTGVKLFGDKGLVVSDKKNRSYTVINDFLFVDRDGNAIVVVHDMRNSSEDVKVMNYTAYKISPAGEFLWGEEGVAVDGSIGYDFSAAMRITQLADGSYVFAWMRINGTDLLAIEMQRVGSDGTLLWNADDVRLIDSKSNYSYPWIVDAGNSQCILVYAKGSNQDLYARKIDFDGTPVWAEDTRIYRGGWGSTPIHTLIDVQPANGGVIVSWTDDRYFTQIESAYLSYVKPNGELGFAAGEEGQKLGYEGLRSFTVKSKYDAKTNSVVSFWRESNANQTWYRMVAQRTSMSGELLWGESGLEIGELQQVTMSYNSVQNGRDGEMALFYMVYTGDVVNKAFLIDIETGESVWENGALTYPDVYSSKADLETTALAKNNFFVTKYDDNGYAPGLERQHEDWLCLQRINYDGTVGYNDTEGVTKTQAEETTFGVLSTIVNGETVFTVEGAGEKAMLVIYDLQGRLVETVFDGTLSHGKQYIEWNGSNLAGGVYIATLHTGNNTKNIKLLIN